MIVIIYLICLHLQVVPPTDISYVQSTKLLTPFTIKSRNIITPHYFPPHPTFTWSTYQLLLYSRICRRSGRDQSRVGAAHHSKGTHNGSLLESGIRYKGGFHCSFVGRCPSSGSALGIWYCSTPRIREE